jgi:hypothetical protein
MGILTVLSLEFVDSSHHRTPLFGPIPPNTNRRSKIAKNAAPIFWIQKSQSSAGTSPSPWQWQHSGRDSTVWPLSSSCSTTVSTFAPLQHGHSNGPAAKTRGVAEFCGRRILEVMDLMVFAALSLIPLGKGSPATGPKRLENRSDPARKRRLLGRNRRGIGRESVVSVGQSGGPEKEKILPQSSTPAFSSETIFLQGRSAPGLDHWSARPSPPPEQKILSPGRYYIGLIADLTEAVPMSPKADLVRQISKAGFTDAIDLMACLAVLREGQSLVVPRALEAANAALAVTIVQKALLQRVLMTVERAFSPGNRPDDRHARMAFECLSDQNIFDEVAKAGSRKDLQQACDTWRNYDADPRRNRLKTYRDKVVAHTAVRKLPAPLVSQLISYAMGTADVLARLARGTGVVGLDLRSQTDAYDASAKAFWSVWARHRS